MVSELAVLWNPTHCFAVDTLCTGFFSSCNRALRSRFSGAEQPGYAREWTPGSSVHQGQRGYRQITATIASPPGGGGAVRAARQMPVPRHDKVLVP